MGIIRGGAKGSSYFREWFLREYGVPPEKSKAPPSWGDVSEVPPRKLQRAIDRVVRREARPKPPPKPKRRKAETRQERTARQREENARFMRDARNTLFKQLRADGLERDYVHIIGRDVWLMAWHIVRDRTGKAGRFYLDRCRNKPFAAAVRIAAFEMRGGRRRKWTSRRARRIVAAGMAFQALANKTRRRGRFNPIVRGVPKLAIAALLKDMDDQHVPSENALIGSGKWKGDYLDGECGYLTALWQVGALYFEQLPPEDVAPWERVGTERGVFALNRYWLMVADPEAVDNDEHRARIIALAESELERDHVDENADQLDEVDQDDEVDGFESRAPP